MREARRPTAPGRICDEGGIVGSDVGGVEARGVQVGRGWNGCRCGRGGEAEGEGEGVDGLRRRRRRRRRRGAAHNWWEFSGAKRTIGSGDELGEDGR